jgi:hypothetical protein
MFDAIYWSHLVQDGVQWRVVINTVMNLLGLKRGRESVD